MHKYLCKCGGVLLRAALAETFTFISFVNLTIISLARFSLHAIPFVYLIHSAYSHNVVSWHASRQWRCC